MPKMTTNKSEDKTSTKRGMGRRGRYLLILLVWIFVCLLIVAGIGVAVWRTNLDDNDDDDNDNHPEKTSSFDKSILYTVHSHNVTFEWKREELTSSAAAGEPKNLSFSLAVGRPNTNVKASTDRGLSDVDLRLEWPDGTMVDVTKAREERFLSCLMVNWTIKLPSSFEDTVTDCFDSSDSFWYGGFEESFQHWPLNKLTIPMAPFVTGDAYFEREIGNVVESLLVASSGFGVYVDETVPLSISFNHPKQGRICIRNGGSDPKNPFVFTQPESSAETLLTYHVCRSTDVVQLWKEMSRAFMPKLEGIPSPQVFRKPIWSTWAVYKGFINQTTVLEFADDILSHGFAISQLEIDDNWTPKYGDFTFNLEKFPDAKDMISTLTGKAIPVTVWMHPFFNTDSSAFKELNDAGYLVKNITNNSPALTSWWRGSQAAILDVTNPKAVDWYLNKTANLKAKFNVTSFKFDAGEVNWLPGSYIVKNKMANPNDYSRLFVQMVYLADIEKKRQETRVGFKTQNLPILVRMIDRDSSWSHQRGLKSLIPTALTFSIMGYPFILPDMIGGNAYDQSDLDKTVLPDAELFVRWLQVTTFMPTLQFSVPPWLYDNATILTISKTFVNLHASFSDRIISLAQKSVVTGEPIVRPLWWISPNDPECLVQDSEFLLGSEVLVAPVLDKGAKSRDIYLPAGRWENGVSGKLYTGPVWLMNFPAPLDMLPYFYKT